MHMPPAFPSARQRRAPGHGDIARTSFRTAAGLGLIAFATSATAQSADPPTTLAHCALIGAAIDRLTCYDRLANRAPSAREPVAKQAAPGGAAASPAPASSLTPRGESLAASLPGAATGTSILSKYWELAPIDQRGTFNLTGYQPTFVLPVSLSNRVNRAPSSPTQAVFPEPDNKRVEAKFQLSMRTKAMQDIPWAGGDLWAAFTLQAYWQIYSGDDSHPFRNTDYQPELTWVRAIPTQWSALPFGWRWRYAQLGLAHESNGQVDPLSRSWNRYYIGTGADNGDWAVNFKFNQRITESRDSDNNPDLVKYIGRGQLGVLWANGRQTALLEYHAPLRFNTRGAVRFEYTYPVFSDQPNGLRWFVQAFSGYGDTMTDYNFRQTSIGAGVTFLQF